MDPAGHHVLSDANAGAALDHYIGELVHVLRDGEEQLRGGYRAPETYRALLGSLGYEPDDGEFPASDRTVIEVPSDPPLADDT